MNITPEHELFLNIAKEFELNITAHEIELGVIEFTQLDQIRVNSAYVKLLSGQIENKKALVDFLKNKSDTESGYDNMIALEDYYKHKRELLDLIVEFAAKQMYMMHHEKITH